MQKSSAKALFCLHSGLRRLSLYAASGRQGAAVSVTLLSQRAVALTHALRRLPRALQLRLRRPLARLVSLHAVAEGVYDFSSPWRNLAKFIRLAGKHGFFVILRGGPSQL